MPTKDFLISCLSKEQFAPNGSFDKGSINFLAELLVSFIQKVKKGQVFLVVVLDGKNHETIGRLPPYWGRKEASGLGEESYQREEVGVTVLEAGAVGGGVGVPVAVAVGRVAHGEVVLLGGAVGGAKPTVLVPVTRILR